MAAQTKYSFSTPKGVAGGLCDLSVHEVISRMNEEVDGKMKFGVGVVKGTSAGNAVKLPGAGATIGTFEGVVLHAFNVEHNMAGEVSIRQNTTVNVIKIGNVWVKLATGVVPTYQESVYLVTTGNDAGCFTNVAGSGNLKIKAVYIGEPDEDYGIAPVKLFNQVNE